MGQYQPASHMRGSIVPAGRHSYPAGQLLQWVIPSSGPKVCSGQTCAATAPVGQKWPRGQTNPSAAWIGREVVAPPAHTKPASQSTAIEALEAPETAQYWPGGHGRQSLTCSSRRCDENIPRGQGSGIADRGPQYEPAGHSISRGVEDPDGQ